MCVYVNPYTGGPQEANSQIDIREDFQKNTFFQMLNVAWGFSAVGRSLAAAQDSCCEDIDVWSQGVLL